MDAVIEKWEEILQTVKSEYEVTDVPFNTWLKPLKVYEVDGKLITAVSYTHLTLPTILLV